MIEVYPNLFIGDQNDYDYSVAGEEGWMIIHACKEPYHRKALGYRGRGAPKDHPEYLVARRDHRLILNIVDTNNPAFFAKEMIDAGLDFIDEALRESKKVLVHCNLGESRSPSIGLLYMAARLKAIPNQTLEAAEEEFRKIFTAYSPKAGIRGHLKQYWKEYNKQ